MLKSINNFIYPSQDDTTQYTHIYIINQRYIFLADSTQGLLNQLEDNDLNITITTQETLTNDENISYIELPQYIINNLI